MYIADARWDLEVIHIAHIFSRKFGIVGLLSNITGSEGTKSAPKGAFSRLTGKCSKQRENQLVSVDGTGCRSILPSSNMRRLNVVTADEERSRPKISGAGEVPSWWGATR